MFQEKKKRERGREKENEREGGRKEKAGREGGREQRRRKEKKETSLIPELPRLK